MLGIPDDLTENARDLSSNLNFFKYPLVLNVFMKKNKSLNMKNLQIKRTEAKVERKEAAISSEIKQGGTTNTTWLYKLNCVYIKTIFHVDFH